MIFLQLIVGEFTGHVTSREHERAAVFGLKTAGLVSTAD
jgi:hypothetical protein